jgi:hypothetical protein
MRSSRTWKSVGFFFSHAVSILQLKYTDVYHFFVIIEGRNTLLEEEEKISQKMNG